VGGNRRKGTQRIADGYPHEPNNVVGCKLWQITFKGEHTVAGAESEQYLRMPVTGSRSIFRASRHGTMGQTLSACMLREPHARDMPKDERCSPPMTLRR
jgi:hypothetical protein